MTGGILGLGLLNNTSGKGVLGLGLIPMGSTSGGTGSALLAPTQARLAALQGTGSIQTKLQAAMAASPIGARLKSLGIGGGTGAHARQGFQAGRKMYAAPTPGPGGAGPEYPAYLIA